MSRMGSSRLWGKFIVLVAVCGWCLSAQAKYAGGLGTEAEPFRISAVSDWQELMATPADWDKHFILTADIDLNDVPITPIGRGGEFAGVFDGNNHIIRNAEVNMQDADDVGLFGYLGRAGQIKNLGVEDGSVRGTWFVGGLVGENHGAITSCYSTASVASVFDGGGLVGYNRGVISKCYSTSSVSPIGAAGSNLGGLVGFNWAGGTISNCYSTGSVSGGYGWPTGGLVGDNDDATISNCHSAGSVTGYWYVGGLVGENDAAVESSFWDVNRSGWPTSAGGTPKTTMEMKTRSTFTSAGVEFYWRDGEWD